MGGEAAAEGDADGVVIFIATHSFQCKNPDNMPGFLHERDIEDESKACGHNTA